MNLDGNYARRYKSRASMTRPTRPARFADDGERIRALFLTPRRVYTVAEAAAVLRMPEEVLSASVRDGSIRARDTGGELLVPWEELVAAAVQRWPTRLIAESLPSPLVPPPVQSSARILRLPSYLWLLLTVAAQRETAARDCDVTVDDLIEDVLHRDIVARFEDWPALEKEERGITAAARWPENVRRKA